MSTHSQTNKKHLLRLNPFVFPSDTDLNFALLVVTVIGVSLFIYNVLYNTIPGVWEHSHAVQSQCAEAAKAASIAHPEILDAQVDTFEQCMLPEDFERAMFMFGAVLFLFVMAGLIYWAMPNWRIWRSKLEPINTDGDPELIAYLANLCCKVGLSTPPKFLWDPLAPALHGLAFGHLGRYYVYLPGGLVDKFYNDQPIFRSELLHELSHLQNKDVDKTYITIAIWWAFVIVALVPFVIGQPYAIGQLGKTWGSLFNQSWRLIALTVFIYLTGCALLRNREMYADVRTSVWDGPTGALRRSLESLSQPVGGRWRSVLGFHPDPRERCQLLDNTDRLFNMSFWAAMGTGIAATITYTGFQFWLFLLTPPSLILDVLEYCGAALVFAPLVIGIVGVGAWRKTFVELARGKPLHGAGRLGLGVGLGAILGQILNLMSVRQFSSIDILWASLLLVSMVFFFQWVGVGAATWLEVAATRQSPRLTYILGLLVAGVVLTLWFTFLYFSSPSGLSYIYAIVPYTALVITPFTIIGFIFLWGYPLVTWFWRKQVAISVGARWAYLDPSQQSLKWTSKGVLRFDLALTIGLIGGMLFFQLSYGISLIMQIATYLSILPRDEFTNWVGIWQAALAVLIQAGVAAVIVYRVKRLAIIHGLFGALTAACVMMIGALIIYMVFSGHQLSYYVQSFPYGTFLDLTGAIINWGTCLALITALVTSFITRWFSHSKSLIA